MLSVIVNFAACLRAYDLRVSTSEVLDCAKSLTLVDALDETVFKTVLRAHFVKTRRDADRFEKVYLLFFHDRHPSGTMKDPGNPESFLREQLDRSLDERKDRPALEGDLLAFLKGDPRSFLAHIHQLHTRPEKKPAAFKSNLAQLSAKLDIMLTMDRIRKKVEDFPETFSDTDDVGLARSVSRQYLERLDQARALVAREAAVFNGAVTLRRKAGDRRDGLGDIPFSNLTGPELAQTRALMERLVRKLKDKAGRRYRARNTGSIDIKKTLRKANRFQGVPLEIVYKQRPPHKGQIMALCDVSGSVWSTARFMLQILYSLQECFSAVRSFAFVSQLAEITGYFKTGDITRAVSRALSEAPVNLNDRTDYGAVFHTFREEYVNDLTSKTTLIILGDGRSNYYNPQAHILGHLRERCRRIIWLTPEPGNTWDMGDCEIHTYRAHCHEVRTCMNLNHLSDFVTELVL